MLESNSVNEHRTPDTLSSENALICEKLLGWTQSSVRGYWYPSSMQAGSVSTPTFTGWYHAGLILDALQSKLGGTNFNTAAWDQLRKMGHVLSLGKLSPADVRAAALAFINAWHGG